MTSIIQTRVLLFTTLFLFLFNCHKTFSKSQDQKFTLFGTFEGKTQYLLLSYEHSDRGYVVDSILVKNKKFTYSGKIDEPVRVWLQGNIKSTSVDDKNLGFFFIEPGEMSVKVKEDHFKEILVDGSSIQNEYQHFKNLIEPYSDTIKELRTKLDELRNSKQGSSKEMEDSISSVWSKQKEKIIQTRFNFIKNFPNSYLSAQFLSSYYSVYDFDSLKMSFEKFTTRIKDSNYGKDIKKKIDILEKIQIGQPAPDFNEDYIKAGEIFHPKDFKGKVLLLDFWAGWCKPCVSSLPKLKKIYETYHSDGLEVIGISYDKNEKEWKTSIERNSVNLWHHFHIGLRSKLGIQYGIYEIPSYILIDRNGLIIGKYSDFTEELEEQIQSSINGDYTQTFPKKKTL